MKKAVIGILLLAMLYTTFRSAGIYVWFKINQTNIAKNLCKYKDAADNQCQGCCVLQKRISETETQKSDAAQPNYPEEKPILLFYTTILPLISKAETDTFLQNNALYVNNLKSYELINPFFRPPEIALN